MEDIFTLKKLLAQAYDEVMSMDAQELENRFGDELKQSRHLVRSITSYSRALSVHNTVMRGKITLFMN